MNQRSPWANWLAIVPIPLLVTAMGALWVADPRVVSTLPPLNLLVHYGPVALGVAFIVIPAARSFLANGQPSVLMLGCGILMMDIGVTVMPSAFARSSDTAFAIYNTSALLGALCHFAGVVVSSRRKIRLKRSATWLTAAYAGGMAAVGLVIWAAFTGRMPVFFIDGQGGTLLRSVVVSTAVALFVLTAGLLWQTNRRTPSPFLYWYALGLVLLAAGLAGSMLIAVRDSPLQWVARLTQVFGMVYMCVAVLASARETSAKGIPLAAVEEAWRENAFLASLRQQTPLGWMARYGLAVVAVVAGFGFWLALTAWFGAGLPPFITFYPVVMVVALLAGFGPGLLATILADGVVAYWIMPPVGQFSIDSPVDRLALVMFGGMGLLMSAVAELYRRNRHKAAAYDREMVLRESREALRESQRRLVDVLESMPDAFVSFDSNLRYTYVNRNAERLQAARREELLGKDVREAYPDPESHKSISQYERVLSEQTPSTFVSFHSGFDRWVEVLAFPTPDGVSVFYKDVSDRVKAEAALRQSEGRWNAAIESFSEGAIIATEAEQVIYWNPAARRMHGFTSETEGIGPLEETPVTFELRTPDGQHLLALDEWPMRRIIRGEAVRNLELRLRRPDQGWEKIVSYSGAMVETAGGERLIFLSVYDLTELRQAEAALRSSLGEKEVLLKEIHHRVKNNMQVISSLVDLQADQLKDDAMRAVLQDVTHRVRSMAMVHEKLYQSPDMARVEFAEYAQSLLNYLWRAHGVAASGIRLTTDLEPVPLSVNAAVPCGLILNELATNALKHAFPRREGDRRREGEGKQGNNCEVRVTLKVGSEGRVCLSVRDNGAGLPAGVDWRRADSLGLRLVQILAKQLGASVEVCSGEGTEFAVKFPKSEK